MKCRQTILSVLLLALSTTVNSQVKLAGVIMPKVMKVEGNYLKMNGGGIREKWWIDLYVAVLYLENKTADPEQIMRADAPMAIKLRIISGAVSNEKLESAIREGMQKSTKGKIAPVADRMEKLIEKGFDQEIEKGDTFDLIYHPKKGTTLQKNNRPLVTVEGVDFKEALFGIWLCDDPADKHLKGKMLGM